MLTYLTYIFSPLIVASFFCLVGKSSINLNELNKKRYLWVVGCVMALFIGLRHYSNSSGDSGFYYQNWIMLSQIPVKELFDVAANIDMEDGYLYTVWLLSHIFIEPQFVFILSGIFFAATICVFVKRNCTNVILGLLVFNCLGEFNFIVQGLRQGIAMCICLWALEKCKKRQFWRFLLLIVVAMSFHASAVVFFPMYFIGRFKFNLKYVVLFIAGCIVAIFSLQQLFTVVNFLINDSYEIGRGIDDGSGSITIFIHLSIVLTGILFYDKNNELPQNKNYALFFYMTCIALISFTMRNVVSGIAERISFYFAFGEMILIPGAVSCLHDEKVKILLTIIIVLLCMGVAFHKASYTILIPYNFCWENVN